MLRIAITGGIGSGKSCACSYIESRGYRVISADAMAREMTAAGGKAIGYIREHFDEEYILPDGSMDRGKMRDLVCRDDAARVLLEEGTTKVVLSDIEEVTQAAEDAGVKALFYEIPLLFEQNSQGDYDQVWLVTADIDTRIARVMQRDGKSREQVLGIINLQLDDAVKIELSDEVIHNDSTEEALKAQVDVLLVKNNL